MEDEGNTLTELEKDDLHRLKCEKCHKWKRSDQFFKTEKSERVLCFECKISEDEYLIENKEPNYPFAIAIFALIGIGFVIFLIMTVANSLDRIIPDWMYFFIIPTFVILGVFIEWVRK